MDLKFHPLSVRYFKRVVTGITDELSVNEWVAEGLINCLTEYLTDLSAYWWLIDLLTRTAKPNTSPYNNFQLFFGKKEPCSQCVGFITAKSALQSSYAYIKLSGSQVFYAYGLVFIMWLALKIYLQIVWSIPPLAH